MDFDPDKSKAFAVVGMISMDSTSILTEDGVQGRARKRLLATENFFEWTNDAKAQSNRVRRGAQQLHSICGFPYYNAIVQASLLLFEH